MRPIPRPLWVLLLALAVLMPSCTDAWRNVQDVDGLRVLAIRAEPPDLTPGQLANLDALVVDPRAPDRGNTLLWFACDPDPSSLDQTPCADYATLQDTSGGQIGSDPAALPPGVRLIGMSPPPGVVFPVAYQSSADLFSKVAQDDPRRVRGVLAIVLVLVVAAPPPWPPTEADLKALLAKVQSKEVDSLLALKRLRISENPTPNHNPALAGVQIGSVVWGAGARPAKIHPGTSEKMVAVAQPGTLETYKDLDADGNLVEKTERLIASWFSTFGELSLPRNVEGATGDQEQELATPFMFSKIPDDRTGQLYVALRDGRGGVDWQTRDLFLCDPFRAAPTLSKIVPPSAQAGATVKVYGEGLDDLLDVAMGSGFLGGGHWDPAAGAFVGTVPSDARIGSAPVTARGKGCEPDPVRAFIVVP